MARFDESLCVLQASGLLSDYCLVSWMRTVEKKHTYSVAMADN